MAETTGIEWCDHTWSPWEGCTKVGPGCDHCYAEARNLRFAQGGNWGAGAPRRRTADASWHKPLQWNARAQKDETKPRVFPSLCDPFDNEVDIVWRGDFMDLIVRTPHLCWLLLTKRIGNVMPMLAELGIAELPENVWLGATVVNQEEANRDIHKLLATPARVRFLSIEPMLGPVDLTKVWMPHEFKAVPPINTKHTWSTGRAAFKAEIRYNALVDRYESFNRQLGHRPRRVDWVISGGESGPHARPSHPDWFRSLRDQCAGAGIPFLFKQNGEWVSVSEVEGPGEHFSFPDGATVRRVGKKLAGRTLDGKLHDGYPRTQA